MVVVFVMNVVVCVFGVFFFIMERLYDGLMFFIKN